MFNSITIYRAQSGPESLDLGLLAEAMVFYRDVHIFIDYDRFKTLAPVCGPDTLLAAMKEGFLRVSFVSDMIGLHTVTSANGAQTHVPVFMKIEEREFGAFAQKFLQELTGKSGKGRRLAEQYQRLVQATELNRIEEQKAGLIYDLADTPFIESSVKALVSCAAPTYSIPQDFFFRVIPRDSGSRLETNLDIATVKAHSTLENSNLTPAHLLSQVLKAGSQVRLSAKEESELLLPPDTSAVAALRFKSAEPGRQDFTDFVFPGGKSIRESVNSGSRTFEEVVKLVADGQRFKEWVNRQPESADLRQEYCRAISSFDWVDKLPNKSLRFLIFTALSTGIGLIASPDIGAAAGIALNSIDYFLVDKMSKGWKPNQFVEGDLRQFLK